MCQSGARAIVKACFALQRSVIGHGVWGCSGHRKYGSHRRGLSPVIELTVSLLLLFAQFANSGNIRALILRQAVFVALRALACRHCQSAHPAET